MKIPLPTWLVDSAAAEAPSRDGFLRLRTVGRQRSGREILAVLLLIVWAGIRAALAAPAPAPAAPAEHWAFQPIRDPALPTVRRSDWVRTGIDRFILARLEERGFEPSPMADRRTLIRRATFDLTGLPPTPAELDAFLADGATDAFARLVERLLASPRHGERWGRHWLDVARYADSNGMDENLAYGSAWRYRDYVVSAFNQDKPYDRFVLEQLAGDLLPERIVTASGERLVATGFLTIGPKMLAEDDPVKMEMDIVDEQLDTMSRAFMGLTVGCGRCHDHKYDPVPMSDYYAMAGIFKSTRTMENFKVVARWQERPLGTPAEVERWTEHRRRLEEQKRRVADLVAEAGTNLVREARLRAGDYLAAARERVAVDRWLAEVESAGGGGRTNGVPGLIMIEAEGFQRTENVIATRSGYGEGIGVIYGPGGQRNAVEYDVVVPEDGPYGLEIRYAAAAARPVRLVVNGKSSGREVAGAVTGGWNPEHQRWETAGVHRLAAGTNVVRLERDDCIPHFDKLVFLPSGRWAADGSVGGGDRVAGRPGGLVTVFIRQWADYLRGTNALPAVGTEAFEALVRDPKGPFRLPKDFETEIPSESAVRLKEERTTLTALERSVPVLPEAMAVSEGAAQDLRIHKRGSHLALGDEIRRGVLRSIGAPMPPTFGTNSSGRLELARWLVGPDHPLTARVMVNRIWHWHFGEGLVRSPDNFGVLGEKPSHPELLDWLARRFIESGWSVKAMHRLIMASAVYQQRSVAADGRGSAAALDPDNRLLSHFSRRRLEVEAIRDSILFVSGGLDLSGAESLLTVSNRVYVTSTANKLDASLFEKPVRSMYLPVVRSALYDVFQVFDFADPSVLNGRRDQTTVAPQALFMMNSRLVAESARRLSGSLLQEIGLDDGARIDQIYRIAYSRLPTESERTSALTYLRRYAGEIVAQGGDPAEARRRSWQSLGRSVMSASEFIYVD